MASELFLSNAIAKAQADVLNVNSTGFGSGVVTIYSNSTTKPANADTALDEEAIALAQITLPDSTLNSVSNSGVITVGTIETVQGLATGTASYFRMVGSDTKTVVMDGNVGLSGDTPDLVLDNTTITISGDVTISSFVYTVIK